MCTEFLMEGCLWKRVTPSLFPHFILLKGTRASGPAAQGRGQSKDRQTQGARPVLGVVP